MKLWRLVTPFKIFTGGYIDRLSLHGLDHLGDWYHITLPATSLPVTLNYTLSAKASRTHISQEPGGRPILGALGELAPRLLFACAERERHRCGNGGEQGRVSESSALSTTFRGGQRCNRPGHARLTGMAHVTTSRHRQFELTINDDQG